MQVSLMKIIWCRKHTSDTLTSCVLSSEWELFITTSIFNCLIIQETTACGYHSQTSKWSMCFNQTEAISITISVVCLIWSISKYAIYLFLSDGLGISDSWVTQYLILQVLGSKLNQRIYWRWLSSMRFLPSARTVLTIGLEIYRAHLWFHISFRLSNNIMKYARRAEV